MIEWVWAVMAKVLEVVVCLLVLSPIVGIVLFCVMGISSLIYSGKPHYGYHNPPPYSRPKHCKTEQKQEDDIYTS